MVCELFSVGYAIGGLQRRICAKNFAAATRCSLGTSIYIANKPFENGGETDINGCPIAIDDFLNKCAFYSDAIKQRATAANISAYSEYLDGCLSRVGLRRYKKTGGQK